MKYQVLGFQTFDTDAGCDAARGADTLREACREARYMLTAAYRQASEAPALLKVVQVWKGDVLVTEYS